jgi:excisionase family DNA binding protein
MRTPRQRRATNRDTYTIPEAGRRLGIGRNQALGPAKRGEIPTIKIGKRILVPRSAFDRLLDGTEVPRSAR